MHNSVEYFAELIRESVSMIEVGNARHYVDSATTGVLRSVLRGPGTDAEARAWSLNALAAGELVRAELAPSPAPADCDVHGHRGCFCKHLPPTPAETEERP